MKLWWRRMPQPSIQWLAACGRRHELQLWLSTGSADRLLGALPPAGELDQYMAEVQQRQRALIDCMA